jgi:hypothetical protein
MISECVENGMDDRREDKTTHPGPLGGLDHAFTDLSLIWQKSWRYIEDGVNALQRRIKARSVTQISYRDLCCAKFPHRFALRCVPNEPANLYASLCKRGNHETGELACSANSEDCRGRTYHDCSPARLMRYPLCSEKRLDFASWFLL